MLEKDDLNLPKVRSYPLFLLGFALIGRKRPLQRARCLPNPCTFSINEITIALSSVDILFHLRREELIQRAEEAEPDADTKGVVGGGGGGEVKDAMAGLVRHVLGQRSFYPIFPPTEMYASEVNLDVTHYPLVRLQEAAPDILILPSKLKHFSKVSE
jgi:DNA polymerase alpha subunit B